jgi:hypothetical protein
MEKRNIIIKKGPTGLNFNFTGAEIDSRGKGIMRNRDEG